MQARHLLACLVVLQVRNPFQSAKNAKCHFISGGGGPHREGVLVAPRRSQLHSESWGGQIALCSDTDVAAHSSSRFR